MAEVPFDAAAFEFCGGATPPKWGGTRPVVLISMTRTMTASAGRLCPIRGMPAGCDSGRCFSPATNQPRHSFALWPSMTMARSTSRSFPVERRTGTCSIAPPPEAIPTASSARCRLSVICPRNARERDETSGNQTTSADTADLQKQPLNRLNVTQRHSTRTPDTGVQVLLRHHTDQGSGPGRLESTQARHRTHPRDQPSGQSARPFRSSRLRDGKPGDEPAPQPKSPRCAQADAHQPKAIESVIDGRTQKAIARSVADVTETRQELGIEIASPSRGLGVELPSLGL